MSRPAREAAIVGALVAFGGVLRDSGVEVGPGRVETAVLALSSVDPGERTEVYWALRCSLLSRLRDLDTFDAAFKLFWGDAPLPLGRTESVRPQGSDEERITAPEGAGRLIAIAAGDQGLESWDDDNGERSASGTSWSSQERLRELDFAAYGADELARARRLVERLAYSLPLRRSRRIRPSHRGSRIDRRRTFRESIRTGGHPVDLYWGRAKEVPRKLVFVVDVSGSMEPYARPIVMFLQAARRASRRVEAFAFGTRLTRLTAALDARDPERSLARVAEAVPDWAGGTRIGESLRLLREGFGDTGMFRGAMVVIVSDGWERGNVPLLAAEMERLQRTALTVIWVNPLAGDPHYEPLAAGMAAALPYVDAFLSGHNLRDLEALAEVLELSAERRVRRGIGQGPSERPAHRRPYDVVRRAPGKEDESR